MDFRIIIKNFMDLIFLVMHFQLTEHQLKLTINSFLVITSPYFL